MVNSLILGVILVTLVKRHQMRYLMLRRFHSGHQEHRQAGKLGDRPCHRRPAFSLRPGGWKLTPAGQLLTAEDLRW